MVLAGHVPSAVGLEGVLQARQHSIEHVDGYLQAMVRPGVTLPPDDDIQSWMRTILSNLDSSRLPALIDKTLAAGTWNVPTLIIYDRAPELYDLAAIERRVKWLGMVPAAARASWPRASKGNTPRRKQRQCARSRASGQSRRCARRRILIAARSGCWWLVAVVAQTLWSERWQQTLAIRTGVELLPGDRSCLEPL
jgi:hypothetical protein